MFGGMTTEKGMSSRIDEYKHLDKHTAMAVVLPMEQIARECVALNYGAHRLLSAMVHAIREKRGPNELADGIETLLNKGLF